MNNIDKLTNKSVIYIRKENQEFLQFRRLLKFSDIIEHAYSVGIEKNYRTFKINREPLEKVDYEKNLNNYKTLCQANNMNYKNIIKANQAHTDNIIEIREKNAEEKIDTKEYSDGLITNKKDLILATTNADCILFLFLDPIKKVIANVHSGWKGTLQEISVKTVKKMKEIYNCNPKDIIVCICPSIRKCHFEVEQDVYEMFYNQFKKLGNINSFIEQKKDKWHIDTVLINKILLKQEGILEENIEDSSICSVCNKDKIHSFRAEGKNYGLATAIISLK